MQRTIYVPRSVLSEAVQKNVTLPSTRKIIRVDSWLLYRWCITHHFVTSEADPLCGRGPVSSRVREHCWSCVHSEGSGWQISQQHLLNYLSANYLWALQFRRVISQAGLFAFFGSSSKSEVIESSCPAPGIISNFMCSMNNSLTWISNSGIWRDGRGPASETVRGDAAAAL